MSSRLKCTQPRAPARHASRTRVGREECGRGAGGRAARSAFAAPASRAAACAATAAAPARRAATSRARSSAATATAAAVVPTSITATARCAPGGTPRGLLSARRLRQNKNVQEFVPAHRKQQQSAPSAPLCLRRPVPHTRARASPSGTQGSGCHPVFRRPAAQRARKAAKAPRAPTNLRQVRTWARWGTMVATSARECARGRRVWAYLCAQGREGGAPLQSAAGGRLARFFISSRAFVRPVPQQRARYRVLWAPFPHPSC